MGSKRYSIGNSVGSQEKPKKLRKKKKLRHKEKAWRTECEYLNPHGEPPPLVASFGFRDSMYESHVKQSHIDESQRPELTFGDELDNAVQSEENLAHYVVLPEPITMFQSDHEAQRDDSDYLIPEEEGEEEEEVEN